ncbi:MAG TPA: DUF1015 domain-containing protein [Bryobacteraceae bacterium]|nr:DUF1015 domain-containing protein [Bryobacteraceae bacterium]
MAQIAPFQPYRYAQSAGDLANLVTQPYDKINPQMQARYLSLSDHHLVRVILGERFDSDTEAENVYTRAAKYFNDWIEQGILGKDGEPAFYAYFQQFAVPDSGEMLTRKGFIGLGKVEDYEARVVHRHEQTLSGPKKDRRQVLEHTRAHFGQIFMLYPDPECRIDAILDEAARSSAVATIRDEYDTVHIIYRISDPAKIAQMQQIMADKKLLIADGHHRYETAMAFQKDNPELEDARFVMMTFVNMHSNGLRILATHRVLAGLPDFDPQKFFDKASQSFTIHRFDSAGTLKQLWEQTALDKVRIGVVHAGSTEVVMLERDRNGDLDVRVLHEELLQGALGISEEQVRDEHFIKYVRGLENAADMVENGEGQIAFLLEPTTIQQVADTSFGGGVMPQKSTDFYPKLLTGLTIYRLEK